MDTNDFFEIASDNEVSITNLVFNCDLTLPINDKNIKFDFERAISYFYQPDLFNKEIDIIVKSFISLVVKPKTIGAYLKSLSLSCSTTKEDIELRLNNLFANFDLPITTNKEDVKEDFDLVDHHFKEAKSLISLIDNKFTPLRLDCVKDNTIGYYFKDSIRKMKSKKTKQHKNIKE